MINIMKKNKRYKITSIILFLYLSFCISFLFSQNHKNNYEGWEGHFGADVNSVCFINNGSTLVSCGADYAIRFWNASTGELIKALVGHSQSVKLIQFTDDESMFLSWDESVINIWNAQNDKIIKSYNYDPKFDHTLSISPDGKYLAIGGYPVKIIDLKTDSIIRYFDFHALCLQWSRDSKNLAVGENRISVYNIEGISNNLKSK